MYIWEQAAINLHADPFRKWHLHDDIPSGSSSSRTPNSSTHPSLTSVASPIFSKWMSVNIISWIIHIARRECGCHRVIIADVEQIIFTLATWRFATAKQQILLYVAECECSRGDPTKKKRKKFSWTRNKRVELKDPQTDRLTGNQPIWLTRKATNFATCLLHSLYLKLRYNFLNPLSSLYQSLHNFLHFLSLFLSLLIMLQCASRTAPRYSFVCHLHFIRAKITFT